MSDDRNNSAEQGSVWKRDEVVAIRLRASELESSGEILDAAQLRVYASLLELEAA